MSTNIQIPTNRTIPIDINAALSRIDNPRSTQVELFSITHKIRGA